jgi:hypothetical protein
MLRCGHSTTGSADSIINVLTLHPIEGGAKRRTPVMFRDKLTRLGQQATGDRGMTSGAAGPLPG